MKAEVRYPLVKTTESIKESGDLEIKVNLKRREDTVLPRLGPCTKRDFKRLNDILDSELGRSETQRGNIKLRKGRTKEPVRYRTSRVEDLSSYRQRAARGSNGRDHARTGKDDRLVTYQRSCNEMSLYNADNIEKSRNSRLLNAAPCHSLYNHNIVVTQRGEVPFFDRIPKDDSPMWRLPKVIKTPVLKGSPFANGCVTTSFLPSYHNERKTSVRTRHSQRRYNRFTNLSTRIKNMERQISAQSKDFTDGWEDSKLEESLLVHYCDLQVKSLCSHTKSKKHIKLNEVLCPDLLQPQPTTPYIRQIVDNETPSCPPQANEEMAEGERRTKAGRTGNNNCEGGIAEFPDKIRKSKLSKINAIKKELYGPLTAPANDKDSKAEKDEQEAYLSQSETVYPPETGKPNCEGDVLSQNTGNATTVTHVEFTAFLDSTGTFYLLPGVYTFEKNDYNIWSRPKESSDVKYSFPKAGC